MDTKNMRIGEIDFLRGIAIILMVTFHILYDLKEFYNYDISYQTGVIDLIGEISALLFITITGISCSLSRNNVFRGIKICGYALVITIITYIYDPTTFINFGILHLLGVSILLYPLFKNFNVFVLLFMGSFIIILGNVFSEITLAHNYLFPLGLTDAKYVALDYYPLFPYLGVFLYGVSLRRLLYPEKQSLLSFSIPPNPISSSGRHSLLIYLIHQPIILAILYLLHRAVGT